jgi:hypothetical protein
MFFRRNAKTEQTPTETPNLFLDLEDKCPCCDSRWYLVDEDDSKVYVHNA